MLATIIFMIVLLLGSVAFAAGMNAGFMGVGSGWRHAYRCKHCRHIGDHWSRVRPCTSCGESTEEKEAQIVARIVWKGKWFNPFTWFNIHYEVKE